MFGSIDFRDDVQSSLPLELALIEFLATGDGARVEGKVERKTEPVVSAPKTKSDAAPERQEVSAAQRAPADPDDEPSAPEPAGADAGLIGQLLKACDGGDDKQLKALLNGSCEIISSDDATVVMGFYHTFHLERIESGPLAARLKELLSQVLGKPIEVRFEHVQRRQREERPKPAGGHLVQAARELGARPTGTSLEGGQDGEG
jgi:hypothetical protein